MPSSSLIKISAEWATSVYSLYSSTSSELQSSPTDSDGLLDTYDLLCDAQQALGAALSDMGPTGENYAYVVDPSEPWPSWLNDEQQESLASRVSPALSLHTIVRWHKSN